MSKPKFHNRTEQRRWGITHHAYYQRLPMHLQVLIEGTEEQNAFAETEWMLRTIDTIVEHPLFERLGSVECTFLAATCTIELDGSYLKGKLTQLKAMAKATAKAGTTRPTPTRPGELKDTASTTPKRRHKSTRAQIRQRNAAGGKPKGGKDNKKSDKPSKADRKAALNAIAA